MLASKMLLLWAFFTKPSRPYRLAMLLAIIALIVWGASHYLLTKTHSATLNYIVDQYGESITAMAADQMMTSALNDDAISSQAIAKKITQRATIHSVIVYDNTNQILAQAINDKDNNESTKEYIRPILSGGNIIGSISISIKPSTLNSHDNISTRSLTEKLILIFLCLAIIICFIKDKLSPQQEILKSSTNEKSTPQAIIKSEKAPYLSNNIIYLTLTIHNMDTLYRQLNGELRQQQLKLLDKNIQHAISLYHGKQLITDNKTIVLAFNDENKDNIANAIYSAQLILLLHQRRNKSMMTMSGFIQESNTDKNVSKNIETIRQLLNHQTPYVAFIDKGLIEKYQLETRLLIDEKTADNEEDMVAIKALQPHYQQLLNNQLSNLLTISE